MLKYERIREQDYWIYPIVFINVVALAAGIWASVLLFRAPALIIAAVGTWFISNKLRRDYSLIRAKIHIATTIVLGALLALGIYVLTN